MDLPVGIQSLDICTGDLGLWVRDVAQAEDQVRLILGPGCEFSTWIRAVVGRVGGGHGVVRIGVVFGVHFGGDLGGRLVGRQIGEVIR